MQKVQQISRRTWLAQVASSSFAVWSELNFGLGRRGWSVAIGGSDLAIGVAHAQNLAPAETLAVNLGFVNAYVLIRGKEAAVVDTGTPNNGSKIADVVRTAGLRLGCGSPCDPDALSSRSHWQRRRSTWGGRQGDGVRRRRGHRADQVTAAA